MIFFLDGPEVRISEVFVLVMTLLAKLRGLMQVVDLWQ